MARRGRPATARQVARLWLPSFVYDANVHQGAGSTSCDLSWCPLAEFAPPAEQRRLDNNSLWTHACVYGTSSARLCGGATAL